MSYTLPVDIYGYDAGTELRDVTLAEARTWECNRCGACCDGLAENVRKDEATGMPMSTWGTKYPDDLYESRYGKRLLQPIVLADGGPRIGDAWELTAGGEPYTAFTCSMFSRDDEGRGCCALYDVKPDPSDLSTMRPRNCGTFPVFGQEIDDALVAGKHFVPATGSFPDCTWHGIRIVGPYRDTPYWHDRWARQQRGEAVADLALPQSLVETVVRRAAGRRALQIVSDD